jgi:type IV pilus assembly protein PilV
MNILQTKKQSGFTLLEVMVSLVIFSVGMLGLAGIQATSIQSNNIAYMRTIAMQSAYDMADIIRASADFNNNVDSTFDNVTTTVGSEPTSCAQNGATLPTCTTAQMAAFEIFYWKTNLQNSLPSGRGTVVRNGTIYTITVMWDQARTGATGENCSGNPADDLKCYSLQTQI